MGLHPNTAAVLVAMLYGVGVFPWVALMGRVGMPGVFLFVGGTYLLAGIGTYLAFGFSNPVTWSSAGLGVATGIIYAVTVGVCSAMFGHPRVNVPVANAITATYPIVTVLVGAVLAAVGLMHQRITGWQAFFLVTGMASVAGLALSGNEK